MLHIVVKVEPGLASPLWWEPHSTSTKAVLVSMKWMRRPFSGFIVFFWNQYLHWFSHLSACLFSLLSVWLEGEQPLRAFAPVSEPPAVRPTSTTSPSNSTASVWFARPGVTGQAALFLWLRGSQCFFPQSLQVCLRAVFLTTRWVSNPIFYVFFVCICSCVPIQHCVNRKK